jgi:hypothetical protein
MQKLDPDIRLNTRNPTFVTVFGSNADLYLPITFHITNKVETLPTCLNIRPRRRMTTWGKAPFMGRAMAQAVSRRPLTTEARVRSQVKSM